MNCPRCNATLTPGDRFCADCGTRIAASSPVPAGGRVEALNPKLAGQTDPGVVHRANQDAFALSAPDGDGVEGALLVVCDGVSNSQTPELASATAARTALAVLTEARAGGGARAAAMRDAIRRAHEAVCALPFDRQSDIDPPATTIVAAWMHAAGATLGWLGDSRAYALRDGGGRLLTRDHSWMAAALESGATTEADALRDPRAHALLHCLGSTDFAHSSACPEPSVAEVRAVGDWLLLCSDGLWNYAETAEALAQAAGEGLHGDAAELCARLVDFARGRGGHDNVTAVAARWMAPGLA
jgi:serine/threonine protein phosphatase PrpC